MSQPAERIEELVLSDAKERAEKVLSEAEKKAKSIVEEARREAEKEAEAIISKKKTEAKAYARRILSEARLKAKLKVLNAKEQLVSEIFDEALKKLKELAQSPTYKDVLESLIRDAAITIGGGDLEILLPSDTNVVLDLDRIAKEAEAETGNKTSLTISDERIKSVGGVIVRSKDKLLTVDNTFESRLERLRERLRVSVANILFG